MIFFSLKILILWQDFLILKILKNFKVFTLYCQLQLKRNEINEKKINENNYEIINENRL